MTEQKEETKEKVAKAKDEKGVSKKELKSPKEDMKQRWSSRKLWFHIAGFIVGIILAYFGKLTVVAASFIVTMSIGYGGMNVANKFVQNLKGK